MEPLSPISEISGPSSILEVCANVSSLLHSCYSALLNIHKDLRPAKLLLGPKTFETVPESFEDFQRMMMEFNLNEPAVSRFARGLVDLFSFRANLVESVDRLVKICEDYYRVLLHRHSVEGVGIFHSPIATDIAIAIVDNIDRHGEIEEGKSLDEVSRFTRDKALILAEEVQGGILSLLLEEGRNAYKGLSEALNSLWSLSKEAESFFEEASFLVLSYDSGVLEKTPDYGQVEKALRHLESIDPSSIEAKDKTGLLTKEEQFSLQFRNETLQKVVEAILAKTSPEELVNLVMQRKQKLHDFFQRENSFYVCRIGQGNPFAGISPGALEVIPGSRPTVNLAEIFGSGYDEVRAHAKSIEHASKWHDLFVATSPSRSADKSNVLLVGPQGCGKSEVLRGIAGDRESIGVFAVGSDFNTCWSGEAQKNPKRLFEAAVGLQKQSRKHIHILIDEIDSVLNDDRAIGSYNLRLEFQILMDGVVQYPNLTMWGATNHLERIPMPMIRRFSKVLIVGELDPQARVNTLKHFLNFLPLEGFNERVLDEQAQKLEGATGDVIRKVVDAVWRDKISTFVDLNPLEAEKMVKLLNEEGKFAVSSFSQEKRDAFKKVLASYVQVRPQDIQHSIDQALVNVGIHNEIETAVLTYQRAREFMSQLQTSKNVQGKHDVL